MKKLLILFVLISNITIAQTFNNYNFNTQNSDQLIDILEYKTGYLLTGYITDSAFSAGYDYYGAPVLIKLTKSGYPIDTLITTNFGYTELAQASVYKNGYFYVFGTTNPHNESLQLVVTKFDTNLVFVEKKLYHQLEGNHYMSINKLLIDNNDSLLFLTGYYMDTAYIVHSYIIKYNINTMSIENTFYLPNDLLIYDLLADEVEGKYVVTVTSSSFFSRALSYDSSFNLISDDTLYSTNYPNFTIQSAINIEEYKDSFFLVLGSEPLAYPINNPYYSIRVMILQVLDSNFQLQNYKYWYYDSLTDIAMSTENALITNTNNEYFVGGTVNKNLYYPSGGLLIVKTDSNLNTLWQKHIDCTAATMRLMNMLPTDDGGVLLLYWEQVSLAGAQLMNSKLIKIGPNGKVTTIYEYKGPLIQPKVSLYPNPATKQITLECKQAGLRINSYIIYDAQGKALQSKGPDKNTIKVDIEYLPKGAYIIQGQTSDGAIFSRKFIKN